MIKKLAQNVKGYLKYTILSPIFMLGEVGTEVFIPLLIAQLINVGIYGNDGQGDMKYILITGGLIAVCALISLFFGVFAGRSAAIASTGFAKNLRKKMFGKVSAFSFKNIDKFSSSSLVTRMTTDVNRLQEVFHMLIRIAIRSPAMMTFSLIMAFTINAKLALIFLAAIPVMVVGLWLIMTKAHPIFKRMFKRYDKLNRVVQENLRGIRVVKAFVREDKEIEKFTEVSSEIKDDSIKAEKILAFNAPLMQMAVYSCILLLSWLGASVIVNYNVLGIGDNMQTGDLAALLNYTMQILMSLMSLSMIFVTIVMSRASAERVCEVLDEESTIRTPDENALTSVADGSIEFKNVFFAYNEGKNVLKNINFRIESGETIGIIGGTGSSKSTLVQLIPRLYDTGEGEVLVGGENVKNYDLHVLRDSVAMVLQKNLLFSGTIKANLRWGNENATDEEIREACIASCADEFVSAFPDGYDTFIEQGGTNVSGGQKQRLCIARALLKSPKILIMDDSTSAVDTKTDAMLRKTMATRIPGTTKLIIAQRISSVQDCDRIIVVDNGEINGIGTHAELIETNNIYREVYESQMKGEEKE